MAQNTIQMKLCNIRHIHDCLQWHDISMAEELFNHMLGMIILEIRNRRFSAPSSAPFRMPATFGNALGWAIQKGEDDDVIRALVLDHTNAELLVMVQSHYGLYGSLMDQICDLRREGTFSLLTTLLPAEVLTALLMGKSMMHEYDAVACAARSGCLEILKYLAYHPAFGVSALSAPCDAPGRALSHSFPVALACFYNHFRVVRWLLAVSTISAEVILRLEALLSRGDDIESPDIRSLVASFLTAPTRSRRELRIRLRLWDTEVADIFALVIFLCEGWLRVPHVTTEHAQPGSRNGSARFFLIAQRLPMELQMRLCHLAVGHGQDLQSIISRFSEPAFKALAQVLK